MTYDNSVEIWRSQYSFRLYKCQNLIYPTKVNVEVRFLCVPLEFEIDIENNPINISYFYKYDLINSTSWPKVTFLATNEPVYLNAAKQVIQSYPGWRAFKNNGLYVREKINIGLHFSYHTDVFNRQDPITLNPDTRPIIENCNDHYQRIIEGKYGNSGLVHLLCIVEKDGNLSKFEHLGSSGNYGNFEEAKSFVVKLGKWHPATQQGKSVRSQMELLVNMY